MKSPNDISSLFKMLGENPEQYQEIVRDIDALKSRERWPLLAAIQASETTPHSSSMPRSSNDLPRRNTQAPVSAKRNSVTEQLSAMPYRKLPNQLTSLFTRLLETTHNQELPSTQKKTSIFERLIR